jgi:hypothetical protein
MWDELDKVVGDRMPEFEDVPRLPTCQAVIKEVLRWRPVTSGGKYLSPGSHCRTCLIELVQVL